MKNEHLPPPLIELYSGPLPLRTQRRIGLQLLALTVSIALCAFLMQMAQKHYMRTAYPLEYSEFVQSYAAQYDIDPSLIHALIYVESGYDEKAVSYAGARGLMQLMPKTFAWMQSRSPEKEALTDDALFDPEINIRYGVLLLSVLYEEFEETGTVLAAYNGGIGNVRKWLQNPEYSEDGKTLKAIPIPETRNYVQKIPRAQAMYRTLYNL